MQPVIWWIRRDLRIQQNPTLKAAVETGLPVIPVFILDDWLLQNSAQKRLLFLTDGLKSLEVSLKELGSGLVIRQGNPLVELRRLVSETNARIIFAEEDFTSYARERDAEVAAELLIRFVSGRTVLHPSLVIKNDGTPYTVFTPFSKTWKNFYQPSEIHSSKLEGFPPTVLPVSLPKPETESMSEFPAGELEARTRLDSFLDGHVSAYQDARNRMDIHGTSQLSPYLCFGMVSPAFAVSSVMKFSTYPGAETWLNELIWREFYQSILYHFPNVQNEAFISKLRNIQWRNSPGDLTAWKDGLTGYPIVDAAMRQLKATGWMHNRARMIAASFLTKDLLINWQEGERWFMRQLVDGDIAANNGGWQWSAGTGTDAAPYFRIFNPILQSKKFDPVGAYIRNWVPELSPVPDDWIHEPWMMPLLLQMSIGVKIGNTYPFPIIDHSLVKERTLAAYKHSQNMAG